MRALLLALLLACGGGASDPSPPSTIKVELVSATPAELAAARERVGQALVATPADGGLIAQLAYVDGLAALLYGTPVAQERVFAPVAPGAPGYRAWVLGKVAYGLTTATKPEQLASLASLLAELATSEARDPWYRWLEARVALLRGDRVAAARILQELTLPPARVDYALVLADEGKPREAARLLGDLGDNALAIVVEALLAVEQGRASSASLRLGGLKGELPPRVAAFRALIDVHLHLGTNNPQRAAEVLAKLGRIRTPPNECAFWERVAWLHLQLGRNLDRTNDHKIAGIARTHCAGLGKATGENQRLLVLDANLQLGLGRPDVALSLASRVPSLWGKVTRAYAELELGHPEAVPPLLADPLAQALPDSDEHRIAELLTLQAQAQLATGKARLDALAKLEALTQSATFDQRARHALGAAYFAIGDLAAAQRELRLVVERTKETSVAPLAYRTHQLLAEIALATDDPGTAGQEIDRALEIHPGNVASYVIKGRVLLRAGDPDRALDTLAPLRKRGELVPAAKLVVAEALLTRTAPSAEQRAQARALVLEVVGKLPPAEVGRVAALVDPKLPAELEVPVGKLPKQKT